MRRRGFLRAVAGVAAASVAGFSQSSAQEPVRFDLLINIINDLTKLTALADDKVFAGNLIVANNGQAECVVGYTTKEERENNILPDYPLIRMTFYNPGVHVSMDGGPAVRSTGMTHLLSQLKVWAVFHGGAAAQQDIEGIFDYNINPRPAPVVDPRVVIGLDI